MNAKRRLILLILTLTIFLLPCAALAGDNPLSLESSSVEDGQTEVSLDTEIVLAFSNNVVNQSVAENNAQCFGFTQNGQEIAIDIVMADDQLHPDLKRIITIKPKESLKKGQTYVLRISAALSAKNGNKIGEDKVISFTTEGAALNNWWYIIGGSILVLCILLVLLIRKRKNGSKEKNQTL